MTESHGMKFVVDTTSIAKGLREYRSAVDGIFSSLDKFESHVAKTMKGVGSAANNKAALNSFRNAVNSFSDVKINPATAKGLGALSAAMKDLRAPSAQQSANLKKFFGALAGLPNLTGAYRTIKSIDDLNVAMRGFKAPGAAQAKNLTMFANAIAAAAPKLRGLGNVGNLAAASQQINTLSTALTRLKAPTAGQVTNLGNFALALRSFNFGNLSGSGNLFATLSGISNFKAPTASQTKNLANFIHTIGTMRVPANATAIAGYLRAIAAAASQVQGSLGGLRLGFNSSSSSMTRFGNTSSQARLQMMGLQNAFSGTFQAGSALRTLLGSLTIGELGREFFEANNDLIKFNAQMGVVSKNTGYAGLQMDFVRKTANALGIDVSGAAEGFGKIEIAASKAGVSALATRGIFTGFSTAMTVLGTTVAGQGDVWLALQQVMNKGYLSAEELNQQMNEKLPGAMAYAAEYAKSLGMTLETGLKKKALEAGDVLGYIAKRYREDFGPSVAAALNKPAAQMTILKNNITNLFQTIGELGVNNAVSDFLATLNKGLDPTVVNNFARSVAEGLVSAVNKASEAFMWLRNNWDSIKGPLATTLSLMGKWMALTATLQIGRSLITPLLLLRGSLTQLTGTFAANGAASTVAATGFARLAAGTTPLLSGLAALNIGMQASIVRANAMTVAANGLKMGWNGITSLFGGPLGMAITALGAGLYGLYSEHTKVNDIIGASQKTISDTSALMETMGLRAATAGNNAQTLGVQHSNAVDGITAFAGATGDAAKELWKLADAQRAANIQKLLGRKQDLQEQNDELWKHTAGGWKDPTPVKGIGDAASRAGNALVFGLDQVVTGGRANERATAQWQRNNREIGNLDTSILNYQKSDLAREVNPAMRDIVNERPGPKKVPEKDDGKTAKKAFSQLQGFENSLDSLLSKLEASDPVGKIVQGWSNTVNDFAKLMLDKGGYMKSIEDAKDPHAKTALLIKELQGGNLNDTAKKGLAARGLTVEELIGELREADSAIDDKLLDAMNKRLESKFKSLNSVFRRLGEDNPVIKAMNEFNADLSGESKELLNPTGYKNMMPVLEGLATGSVKAEDATAALIKEINNGNTRVKLSADVQGQLTTALDNSTVAYQRNAKTAKDSMTFGLLTMKQRREEIGLLSMTTTQQKALALTQQAVNDAKAKFSQADVNAFYEQAMGAERFNSALERQKQYMENNGIRQYLSGVQRLGEAIQDIDKNILKSFEDSLVSIAETGKVSFKGLKDAIVGGINRFAAQGITEKVLNFVKPGASEQIANGQNPSILGGLFGKAGVKLGPDNLEKRLGLDSSNPMYVAIVNYQDGSLSFGANPNWKPVTGTDDMSGLFGNIRSMMSKVSGVAGDGLELAAKGAYAIGKPVVSNLAGLAVKSTRAIGGGMLDGLGISGGDAAAQQPGFGMFDPKDLFDAQGVSKALTDTISLGSKAAVPYVTDCFGTGLDPAIEVVATKFGKSFDSSIAGIAGMFGSMLGGVIGGGGGTGSKILGAILSIGSAAAGAYMGGGFGGSRKITGASTAGLNSSAQSVISSNPGIFKEGGFSNAPVARSSISASAFTNAPHYKEGTHNTSGIPAVLHDNEAVIPLSRGRKVPVEVNGGDGMGGGNTNIAMPEVHVSVHNYGDSKARVEQSQNADGSLNLDVIIEQIEQRMAGKINKGGSPINKSLERRYGVNAAQGNF
jgi:tape measure domain-containing protein